MVSTPKNVKNSDVPVADKEAVDEEASLTPVPRTVDPENAVANPDMGGSQGEELSDEDRAEAGDDERLYPDMPENFDNPLKRAVIRKAADINPTASS